MTLEGLRNYYFGESSKECVSMRETDEFQQIVLIRHGEPDVSREGLFSREAAKKYKEDYAAASIINYKKTPVCHESLPKICIFHSSLRRAEHTAELMFAEQGFELRKSDRFVEFERLSIGFPLIKMPIRWWNFISRFLWFLGINQKGHERFPQARNRVKEGAEKLEAYAAEHRMAVLVAHGIYNKFLGFELSRRKWKKVHDQGGGYLGFKIYAKEV